MDAWFSYILTVFYIFVIAAFFAYLAKMFPQRHIFEISMLLLGRWGGTAVNLLILFHFWQILMQDMASASKYNSTLLLHNTPLEILVLSLSLLLMYFGKSSVEIVGWRKRYVLSALRYLDSVDAPIAFERIPSSASSARSHDTVTTIGLQQPAYHWKRR